MTKRSEQLENEAARTRAQLATSIEELLDRLSPSHVLDRVLTERQKASAVEFAHTLGRVGHDLRENPLPAALSGGLVWIIAKRIFSKSEAHAAGENGAIAAKAASDAVDQGRGDPIYLAGLVIAGSAVLWALSPAKDRRVAHTNGGALAEGRAQGKTDAFRHAA
jgi:hypothetical protein